MENSKVENKDFGNSIEVDIKGMQEAIAEFKKFMDEYEKEKPKTIKSDNDVVNKLKIKVDELENENKGLKNIRDMLNDKIKKLEQQDPTIGYVRELEKRLQERDEELEKLKKERNIVLAYKEENKLLKEKLESLNNSKSLAELYYETIWKILS